MGKLLIVIGMLFILAGVFIQAGWNIPLGRLPGDIRIDRENFSFYFPITSGILVSLILSGLWYLLSRFK